MQGHFEGQNVNLGEDFVTTYESGSGGLRHAGIADLSKPGQRSAFADGDVSHAQLRMSRDFSRRRLCLALAANEPNPNNAANGAPKTVIALFDTSLSMQWEKLERSYQALETLLHALRPQDHFGLVLFNSETQVVPVATAEPGNVQRAIDCCARQSSARRHGSAGAR